MTDGEINEITMGKLGKWPSFEAQAWACRVAHAVLAAQQDSDCRKYCQREADQAARPAAADDHLPSPTGEQLYTMVTSRFKSGSFPWATVAESGKEAWSAAAAELAFAPDTIMAKYSPRPAAADAGGLLDADLFEEMVEEGYTAFAEDSTAWRSDPEATHSSGRESFAVALRAALAVRPTACSADGQGAAVAAIEFALESDDGDGFLRNWFNGEFDICREHWPEAPEGVYIGADPLYRPAAKGAGGQG